MDEKNYAERNMIAGIQKRLDDITHFCEQYKGILETKKSA